MLSNMFARTTALFLFAALTLCSVGCDEYLSGDDTVTADQRAKATAAVTTYATCASSCFTASEVTQTDRATCQLNCKQVLETELSKNPLQKSALAIVPKIDGELDACVAECAPNRSADDRATCMLTCTLAASERSKGTKLDPNAAPPKEDTCKTTCAARLEMCTDNCKKDKTLSTDDRATCNLQCTNTQSTCLEDCALKH